MCVIWTKPLCRLLQRLWLSIHGMAGNSELPQRRECEIAKSCVRHRELACHCRWPGHTHSPRRLSRVTNSRVVAADSQENCLLRCSKTSNGEVPASRLELSPGADPDKGSGACSRPRSPNGGFTGLSVVNSHAHYAKAAPIARAPLGSSLLCWQQSCASLGGELVRGSDGLGILRCT